MSIQFSVEKVADLIFDIHIKSSGQLLATLELQKLPWDTKVLGLSTGRIVGVRWANDLPIPIDIFKGLPFEMQKLGLAYVTFRKSQGDWAVCHEFEKAGFRLIDIVADYSRSLTLANQIVMVSGYTFRQGSATDGAMVANLTLNVFTLSRFHNDPILSLDQCNAIFSTWALNSCAGENGEIVWMIEVGNRIAGFVTCSVKGQIGTIGLLMVSSQDLGKGLGRALVAQAENWFLVRGCTEVRVQTQTNNYRAMGLYSKLQYQVRETKTTLRWATN